MAGLRKSTYAKSGPIAAAFRALAAANREERLARKRETNKRCRERGGEELKYRYRQYYRKWLRKNRARRAKYQREYREKNREKYLTYLRAYKKKHRWTINLAKRKTYAKNRAAELRRWMDGN